MKTFEDEGLPGWTLESEETQDACESLYHTGVVDLRREKNHQRRRACLQSERHLISLSHFDLFKPNKSGDQYLSQTGLDLLILRNAWMIVVWYSLRSLRCSGFIITWFTLLYFSRKRWQRCLEDEPGNPTPSFFLSNIRAELHFLPRYLFIFFDGGVLSGFTSGL